jgi:hypothetical protein
MGDGNCSTTLAGLFEGGLDDAFGLRIESRSGFVEKKN